MLIYSKVQQQWDFYLYVLLVFTDVLIANCLLLGYFIINCTKKMQFVAEFKKTASLLLGPRAFDHITPVLIFSTTALPLL